MQTIELLDEIKRRRHLVSDYALAKHLGEPVSRISKYRNGHVTIGDELALRIADELELERGQVLAWIAAERALRAEKPELAKAWQRVARRAAAGLVAAIGVQISAPPSSAIAAPAPSVADSPACVLCKIVAAGLRTLVAAIAAFRLPILAL